MSESGTALAAGFYRELVAPILGRRFPGIEYAAGRLGSGSDVLGLDDGRSQDHDFGCRLTILLDDSETAQATPIRQALEGDLPDRFRGWPVRFPVSWKTGNTHNVWVSTVREFGLSRLGVDPASTMSAPDWLCLTGQSVLEVTAGPVFHDETRELSIVRRQLDWYPHDLWLYVLSAGWARLGQELPFVGRAGERGDDAGSRVIAARLARDLMHLWFLIERRWPPYPKWAGTVMRQSVGGSGLSDRLQAALKAEDWQERQVGLAAAVELLAVQQGAAGLPSASPAVVGFFDRPFLSPVGSIHDGLREAITDPDVRRLPAGIGSVEQWSDNVDFLSQPTRRAALRSLYREWVTVGRTNPDDGHQSGEA